MKIIVDTNIIFSSLLNKNSSFSETLLFGKFEFFMPKYGFVELFKYKEKISRYSKHSEEEILELLHELLKNIIVFDEEHISSPSLKKAHDLVLEVDEKDLIFVALTLELNGLLWTGDKKLINHLKNQKAFQQLFTPQE